MTQDLVKKAIQNFCTKFIENPYLHRCEHSLHISLYNELFKFYSNRLILNNNERFSTNYIHKEFPGRKTDTSKNNLVDRTQIDIVVLAKNQETNSINDFLLGNFEIEFSFELALEYGIEHLCWDIFKYITGSNKSRENKNYIIHLYNKEHSKKNLDNKEINTIDSNILSDIFESCYYLISLGIIYSKNKDEETYKKILDLILPQVYKKNIKYNEKNYNYLYEDENAKNVLQKMKFIFIAVSPKLTEIKLMNI